MGVLQEVLAKFSIDVDTSKLSKAGGLIGGFTSGLRGLGGLIAGAAVGGVIKGMVTDMVDLGSSINDMSARLGVSTNDLQEWQYVIGQTGGQASDVEPMFRTLQKNIAEVGGASAKAGGLLDELGVKTKDAEGKLRPMGEIATDAGVAIAALEDPAQRSKAALDLFGRAGGKLIPVFAEGREGFAGMVEQYEALGGGLSEDAIGALDDLGDKTDQFELALNGLKAQMVVGIAPAITKVTSYAGLLAANFRKGDEGGGHLKNVLIGVGIAGAIAGAAALAPWLLTIAALGLVGLVVDDVITAFEGGNAVTKRFMDYIFGKDASDDIFRKIKKDVNDLSKDIAAQNGLLDKLAVTFGTVGGSIVKFFADDIPAAIGVATKQMKGADTTWRDLFKDAGTLEQEVTDKRHQSYRDATATQRATLLENANAEVAKWEKFEAGLSNDQKLFRRQKFEAAGTVDPADQWRENQRVLKSLVGNDQNAAGNEAWLAEQKQVVADLHNTLSAAGVAVEGRGYATSRTNEEYGTRFVEDGAGGFKPQGDTINASPVTNVSLTINTTDLEALGITKDQIMRAVSKSNEAAINALTEAL